MSPSLTKKFFWIVTIFISVFLGIWLSILMILALRPEIVDLPLVGKFWVCMAEFLKFTNIALGFIWLILTALRIIFAFTVTDDSEETIESILSKTIGDNTYIDLTDFDSSGFDDD